MKILVFNLEGLQKGRFFDFERTPARLIPNQQADVQRGNIQEQREGNHNGLCVMFFIFYVTNIDPPQAAPIAVEVHATR